MILPWWLAEYIVTNLLNLTQEEKNQDYHKYFKKKNNDQNFITGLYLPTLKPIVEKINVSLLDKIRLFKMLVSLLMKVIYSFIWQEENPVTHYLFGYY